MRTWMRLFVAICCALPAACATPGPKLIDTVTPIRAGVQQAKEQSELAFTSTNAMADKINVARVLESDSVNLRERDFPRAIAPQEREQWATAFGALDSYLHEVQKLVDPARAATTTTELDALAAQLRDGRTQLNLPPATVAAFTTFTGALVQMSAERKALSVMRGTDHAFNEVTTAMADAIGGDNNEGLRATVRAYWANTLAEIRDEYSGLRVRSNTESQQRQSVADFMQALDERDKQLRDLGSLQSSLLALGQAHSAAAKGEPGDALFWVQRISTWLDEAKRRASVDKAAGEGEAK